MSVFSATTGCLIGAQMRCHFLSRCGYNRPKVIPPKLLCLQSYRGVHSTRAKVEKCTCESGTVCQNPLLKKRKQFRDKTMIHNFTCWLLLHRNLSQSAIKGNHITSFPYFSCLHQFSQTFAI